MEPGQVLADQYRLDERLGAGGMGEVWRGTDLRMERPVAIKVVLTHLGPEHRLVERLLREAKAAGGLQHPGITVVHNIGEHDDRPFFVMELLGGENLATALRRHPDGLALDQVLSVAEQVCDALAAAHEQGIVHRDVKPANLILLPNGSVKICDFGVAKLADATTGLSHGNIIGTPSYMSPEQVKGTELDGRTDLYSLGCAIYALLAGTPPFRGDQAPMAIAYQHLNEPPPPLRDARPDVPPAVAELITELLAKDPADRPADAATVRDRFRALRTTTPANSPETITEVARPHEPATPTKHLPPPPEPPTRAPTTASVLTAVLAVATLAMAVLDLTIYTDLALPALVAFGVVAAAVLLLPHPKARPRLLILYATAAAVAVAIVVLDDQLGSSRFPTAPVAIGAGFGAGVAALALLRAPARLFLVLLVTGSAATVGAFVDRGGPIQTLLVLAAVGGVAVTVLVVLDAPARQLHVALVTVLALGVAVFVLRETQTTQEVTTGVAATLAAVTVAGLIGLVSPLRVVPVALVTVASIATSVVVAVNPFAPPAAADTGSDTGSDSCAACPGELPASPVSTTRTSSVAFSPDGNTMASSGGDAGPGAVRLWPLTGTATTPVDFHGPGGDFTSVAFSPDGGTLAFAGSNAAGIGILHRATGQVPVRMASEAKNVYSVAFSPDGKTLAGAGTEAAVRLWDPVTGRELGVLTGDITGSLSSLAFSPDGTKLAGAGGSNVIYLWDVSTGNIGSPAVLTGHTGWINSVAFSRDSSTLASGSRDTTVRLWDVATQRATATLTGHTGPVSSVAFSPDGKTLASGSWDYTIRLWNMATAASTGTIEEHTGGVASVAFRPNGRTLASGSYDGTIRFSTIE
ncbi:serine/threonine protein kinase [Herbihabitans rhizosphaerae]|uniref:non-specific serine/threonine protein kinase n=1 Tax=Herbihabitans rhizosphaerae TaxID=1872711 RepID=A0A4Q7KLW2_9PSEU|nr:serine/threonine-protein kinase [Herbihabitans rhizosphaerae]RZS36551.1 serine/threonine protein kinase [Herbihabitans rhizosphaerae]